MALRLINVAGGGGNAGTAASLGGAELFNRAMKGITKGVEGVVEGENKIFREDSAQNTQDLIQGLDTATTDTADQLRVATQKALDDPMLTRQDKAKLNAKLNTLDQDIGARETAAISLANTRETQADEQYFKGLDRTGLKGVQEGTTADHLNKLASIDKKLEGVAPERRQAMKAKLINQLGLGNDKLLEKAYRDAPRDKDGKIDQAAFKEKAFNLSKDVSRDDVNNFVDNLKKFTGQDIREATERANAADLLKRQRNMSDKQNFELFKENNIGVTAKAQEAVAALIDEDMFDIFGTTDRQDAQREVGIAISNGATLPEVRLALQGMGRGSYMGNLDLEGLRKALGNTAPADKFRNPRKSRSNANR